MGADGTLTVAGSRISRLLREEWTTRGDGVTGADGRVAFRGFYGSYDVGVGQIVQEVRLTKSAPSTGVRLTE